ncbi:MAG: YgiQ family radical SAM protein [Clostridiales bacterium GWF2_38_85]|nr:MAG: YgiQ family radical SAM protein [Clostridiales bacterium GWF2_38_85]HBL83688.1 YgiQ family radical SAM protein [Clostridiales bacterium]
MILGKKPLPITKKELEESGITRPDFVLVTGDAYVDHPSFGTAIISRVLEANGYTISIIPQPDWRVKGVDRESGICVFGKPRLGFLVNAGNIDSMVAHYTASKKRRSDDYYSPGKKSGLRPDRAVIVYCNLIRQAYGDVPIIIGGLEASLRRFAHYDYWSDSVRRSILIDSRADILSYGMGEYSITSIATLLNKGVPVKKIKDVLGTCYICPRDYTPKYEYVDTYDYDILKTDKKAYAKAFKIQHENNDSFDGKAVVEYYGERKVVQNPPAPQLTREELDKVYSLPYTRRPHSSYDALGGVPAIQEVEFSITHNRGCFGGCAFCAISYHQGRCVTSRSIESVVEEARLLTTLPGFKGYIHDIGGPTANFRYNPCEKVRENNGGVCKNRRCLAPNPCKNLICDHSEYIELLNKVATIDGVKKVFIRSGIRFDYVMADKDDSFFRQLISKHVSGQLKVAPEHISLNVLALMGKPNVETYNCFYDKYFELSKEAGLEQYLVPYLMSSHPGSTLNDALELAIYLKDHGIHPEQVQDFYPTPGTASTVMYYTEIDPFTGKAVYVPKTYEEKQMQRALLQYSNPKNAPIIKKALNMLGKPELYSYLLSGKNVERPYSKENKKEDKKPKFKSNNAISHKISNPRNRNRKRR